MLVVVVVVGWLLEGVVVGLEGLVVVVVVSVIAVVVESPSVVPFVVGNWCRGFIVGPILIRVV